MLSRKTAAICLIVLALALTIGNCFETFHRSAIPLSLDGNVDRLQVRQEKHPGVDDVHLVTINGTIHHVDAALAKDLVRGDQVQKEAWSSTLTSDGESRQLGLSGDAKGMLLVMPLAFVVVALLLFSAQTKEGRG